MRSRELHRWLERLASLTPHQREQVKAHLRDLAGRDAVTELLEERVAPTHCPGCQGEHWVRNGQADGLQRFKCRDCGITFNSLTGTPLARLRHRQKWLEQAKALEHGLSVRKAAVRLGVHRTTAFRWRHRFLTVPRDVMDRPQAGVVEADEAYFKGQPRRLREATSRPAQRRGGSAAKRGLCDEQVGVPVQAMLTDNGREFCGKPDQHPYELLLAVEDIEHRTARIATSRTNGFVERMNRTLLDECFRVTGRQTWYLTPAEVQRDLDAFLRYYNLERSQVPHGCR